MRIGILVNKSTSIFTNGCLQQGYFLLKSFRKANIQCNFVTAADDFQKFDIVDEDVHLLKTGNDLDRYDLLVFSSGSINNNSYMSYCKLKNIKMVNLCVGNYYIINQEEFVFGLHKSNDVMSRMFNKFIDEIWLMPMYSHNINYMKYITKSPLNISPYVWDSTFIDMYCNQKKLNMTYNPKKTLLDVVILEPNVSTHKTSLVPLLICEEFYNKYPDKLGKIYMFCEPKSNFKNNLWYLKIFQNKKVEFFDRIISMELYNNLNNLGKKYVVLSSNIRNGLNFLHLECFKLGIPIIHNCKPFKNSGLYYQEDDNGDNYPLAVKHLLSVFDQTYIQNTIDILEKYHPNNQDNVNNYKKLADNIVSKNINLVDNMLSNLKLIEKRYNLSDELAIVFITKNNNITNINKNIDIFNKLQLKYTPYIINKSGNTLNNINNIQIIESSGIDIFDVYRNILHKSIVIINNDIIVQFDIKQIIDKGDIVGIESEKSKELYDKDYNYYYSILETLENILPKNTQIKIYENDLLFIRNSENIINSIDNIKNIDNYDEITITNIIFQMFYSKKISLTNNKFLIYSNENSIIGKGYTNGKIVLYYKISNDDFDKKIVNDDELYKFIN